MTVKQLFDFIKGVRPGFAFTDAQLTVWLNEIEGHVQTDIWLLEPAVDETQTGLVEYDSTIDPETGEMVDANHELLVPFPWDKLYRYFLLMSIDLANGEYQRYANSYELFNEAYEEYAGWYAQHVSPANGEAITRGYYISAYQFAVKGGYTGTENEFAEALGEYARSSEQVHADRIASEAAATAAGLSATSAQTHATTASQKANLAAQWATGSTIGTPSATNNAQAYAEEAEMWANGGVAGTPTATNNAEYYANLAKAHIGAPLTASSAEDMTDTDRVYVYVGTTTASLTNGNWYYYDGEDWAEGGVYNSTAFETDATLTYEGLAADAAATGEVRDMAYAGLAMNRRTGNPAVCTDVLDGVPIDALSVKIEMTQTGSGEPSPTNPRPITGWDSAVVTVKDGEGTTQKTITRSFPNTVYAGSLDVLSGKLTITHGYAESNEDGDLVCVYPQAAAPLGVAGNLSSGYAYFAFPSSIPAIIRSQYSVGSYCSLFKEQKNNIPTENNSFTTTVSTTYKRFEFRCTSIPGWTEAATSAALASAVKSYIAGLYPNNKLQLVYRLETPIVVALTPEQVFSMTGYNTVGANCGTVSVAYRTDSINADNSEPDTDDASFEKLRAEAASNGHIKYYDNLTGHNMSVYDTDKKPTKCVDGSQYIPVKTGDIVTVMPPGYQTNYTFTAAEVYIYFYDENKNPIWSVFDYTNTTYGEENRITLRNLRNINGLQFALTDENAASVAYVKIACANDNGTKLVVWDGGHFGIPVAGYPEVLVSTSTKQYLPDTGEACIALPEYGDYLIAKPGYTFLRSYAGVASVNRYDDTITPGQVVVLKGADGPKNVVIVRNYTYGAETPTWDKDCLASDLTDAVCVIDTQNTFSAQKSAGAAHLRVKRLVDALTEEFVWSPVIPISAYESNLSVTFKPGVKYRGIPYNSSHTYAGAVGWHVSKRTFMSSTLDADSVFYKGHPDGLPYYNTVCSTFATLVTGFRWPMTNLGLMVDPNTMRHKTTQPSIGEIATNGFGHCVVPMEIYNSTETDAYALKIAESVAPLSKYKVVFNGVRDEWSGIGSSSYYMEKYRICCAPSTNNAASTTPYDVESYSDTVRQLHENATAVPYKGDCGVSCTSSAVKINIKHRGGTATKLYVQQYDMTVERGIPKTSSAVAVGSPLEYDIPDEATQVSVPAADLTSGGIYGVYTDLDESSDPGSIEYFEYYDYNTETVTYSIVDGQLCSNDEFWYLTGIAKNYTNPPVPGYESMRISIPYEAPKPNMIGEMPSPPPPPDYSKYREKFYITNPQAFFKKGKFGAYVAKKVVSS